MRTALLPHSADDCLLSASSCSSSFAVFCRCTGRKVRGGVWREPRVSSEGEELRSGGAEEEYVEVLEEWGLRWSDRFLSLTVWELLGMRDTVWPRAASSQSESATFLHRYWQLLLKPTATSSGGARWWQDSPPTTIDCPAHTGIHYCRVES